MTTQVRQCSNSATKIESFLNGNNPIQPYNKHLPESVIKIIEPFIGTDCNKWNFTKIIVWDSLDNPNLLKFPISLEYNKKEQKVSVKVFKQNSNNSAETNTIEFAYSNGLPLDHFPYHEEDKTPFYDNEKNISLSAEALSNELNNF